MQTERNCVDSTLASVKRDAKLLRSNFRRPVEPNTPHLLPRFFPAECFLSIDKLTREIKGISN